MLFNPTLQITLDALVQRIIPEDEDPGAFHGGAMLSLEHQLHNDLSDLFAVYERGLAALSAEATVQFGQEFAALDEAQQDRLLGSVEAGAVQTPWDVPPSRFFAMVVQHVAEGYYGQPIHEEGEASGAGVRASWTMLGFEERCEAA
jgi:hypothetical protein